MRKKILNCQFIFLIEVKISKLINQLTRYVFKGEFTLDVKDSSNKSPNIKRVHLGPKPIYHEYFMLS